jgi:hypothetical protein
LLSAYNFIVIPIKYHNFGAFGYDSAEKQMLSAISLVIEQRKKEFDRIAKVCFFPIYFYALRGWYHFPDTYQDLFLAERVISQVLKTSYSVLSQSYAS